MMRIAIRDDDTSYWTDVALLDRTVGRLWRAGAPVSLAIVPNSVRFEAPWDRALFGQGGVRKPLGENAALTDYLRDLVREGRVTPMLHGIDHRYAFVADDGETTAPVGRLADMPQFGAARLVGEFAWKDPALAAEELKTWLAYLGDVLGCRIGVFVPPSNAISRDNARAVYAAGLDICGAIAARRINRPLTPAALRNYVVNTAWRVVRDAPYPGALRYGARLDRPAHATPTPDALAALWRRFAGKRRGGDLIIATHWYDYERCPTLADEILALVNQSGCEAISVEAAFVD